MKEYYPIAVKLKNKNTLVIGGGAVAQRKVKALLAAGARVRVISPALTPLLCRLFGMGRIEWKNKYVSQEDLDRADLVIAATSDTEVNKSVSVWAKKRNALINVVDRPALSNFISPAVFKKSKAIVAVYTDGKDPVLSRDLKNFLKENWDEFLSYRRKL
jgi:siroheme synthase-like protein